MIAKKYFLAAVLLSASLLARAGTIVCVAQGNGLAPKSISWNTNTHVAHIDLGKLGSFTGEVALTRKFNDGLKVNIMFRNVLQQSELEYIVFPLSHGAGTYRIIGVGYERVDGKRYLSTGLGEYKASCKT